MCVRNKLSNLFIYLWFTILAIIYAVADFFVELFKINISIIYYIRLTSTVFAVHARIARRWQFFPIYLTLIVIFWIIYTTSL